MAIVLRADPQNFVVDQFTFVRPPEWKWVWDEKRSKIGNLLDVQGTTTNETASVFFWKFKKEEGSPDARTKAWQAYFKEPAEDLNIRSETKKVGTFDLVYIQMEGTNVRDRHTYALFGAIIKMKEANLVVRMSGWKRLMENSKTTFREMIETALKEKEPD